MSHVDPDLRLTLHGADRPSLLDSHAWRVRIGNARGEVYGAGVLVDPLHVLTCAHVVAAILRSDPAGHRPDGQVLTQFPFAPRTELSSSLLEIEASVEDQGWVPTTRRGQGDLALLRLRHAVPEDLKPASLDRPSRTPPGAGNSARIIKVFGHPNGLDDGVWVNARVSGVGGPQGEWLQLDAATLAGRSVSRGFSGAGALDSDTGQVIGVVVAEDRDRHSRVAWVIHVTTVAAYLPQFAALLPAPGPRAGQTGSRGTHTSFPRVPERRLSNVEWQQLFSTLRAVPGMADRSSRDLYLRDLERWLGTQLEVQRREDDHLDLMEFLHVLLDRPGSLHSLVRILATLHPESTQVADLEKLVERTFPELLLEQSERSTLLQLLAGVSWARVGAAFRSATAGFGIPPVIEPSPLSQVIQELEGHGRRRGGPPPPLLAFVDDLAHTIGGRASNGLHRWIDQVAARLEVPTAAVQALCRETERRQPAGTVYLLVRLEPDLVDPERFLMSTTLMHGELSESPLQRDDVPRTVPEVIEALDDVLRLVPEALDEDADNPVIEFILPRQLLGEAVEEWPSGEQDFRLALGLRFPVVIRSLDRMRETTIHWQWRRRSRLMAENGRRAHPSAVFCLTEGIDTHATPPGQKPEAEFRAAAGGRAAAEFHAETNGHEFTGSGAHPEAVRLYAHLASDQQVFCLALPLSPEPATRPQPDFFAAGIRAGTPAIVWARDPIAPLDFRQLVLEEFASHAILDLPCRTYQYRLRREAVGDRSRWKGHLRRPPRIGLLFDDATRIPSEFRQPLRLRAPRPPRPSDGNPGPRK